MESPLQSLRPFKEVTSTDGRKMHTQILAVRSHL
jgi:hypothetical protein